MSITTVREHLPAVIERVGKLLREPAFAPEMIEELRSQWLAAIETQRHEPHAVVADAVARHGNPYPRGDLRHARSFDEQVQDVRTVSADALSAFHRRFVSAARSEFAAVGDIDVPAVRAALEAGFAGWIAPEQGALAYARIPRPLIDVPPQRFMLATPDKASASLLAVLRLPLDDRHPDYPAMVVANHIFGYPENGRLWTRIREKEGLSYDVRSTADWSPFEPNSRWAASAIFAPQNQPRVERAFGEELARSLKEGFTPQELDEARASLLNLRRLARAQDEVVAGQLAMNLHLGRTFAVSQQVDEAIGRLTLDEVNAAWRRHIDPARLVIAWGGDFKP